MIINVSKDSKELGKVAAQYSAEVLNEAIKENGEARLLLSTGASQFDVLEELVKMDIDWSKVEMFHLDEYISIPESHPASFRRYLKERFANLINLKAAHFVNGEGNIENNIRALTQEVRQKPIDLALVGIGENGHIAFNDPPADFDTKEAYIVVNLDKRCKMQQVGEGWFATIDDVPDKAITMTCYQIMQSKVIASIVPHKVKAEAVKLTLEGNLTNKVPATILKEHNNWSLFLDNDSASLISLESLSRKYRIVLNQR